MTKKLLVPMVSCFMAFTVVAAKLHAEEVSSTWVVEPGIRQEGGWPVTNSIVKLADGSYRSYNADRSPWSGSYPIIINSAVSPDGLVWTKENKVLVGNQGYWAGSPETVLLPDGRIRMYFDNERFPFGDPQWGRILSAVSTDGLEWTIEEGVRVMEGGPHDSVGNNGANIVKLPDGRFRMYYSGFDGSHYRILSAISTDGLAWTKEDGVRIDVGASYDALHASAPHVIQLPDGGYLMIYSGFSAEWSGTILSAVSADGLTWQKEPGYRLEPAGIVGGPYSYVSPGALVRLSDYSYRLYFAADRYPNVFAGNRLVTLSAVGTITPKDKTPPALLVSAPADGSFTNKPALTVAGRATDNVGVQSLTINGSPVALNAAGEFTLAVELAAGSNSIVTIATDKAGNAATDVRNIILDQAAPKITITGVSDGAAYTLGAVPAAGYLASDELSGIASQSEALSGGNGVGTYEYTVKATDKAGNSATAVASYTVTYDFSGFLAPVSLGKPFRLGSTIPVKFKLADAAGRAISTAGATIAVQKYAAAQPIGDPIDATPAGGVDAGNTFRYSATDSQYIYNLRTDGLSEGTWQIRATLDDGTVQTAFVSLK